MATKRKRTKARAAAAGARLMPPAGGVVVRMYRHGLGDCLLVAADRQQPGPFYMMIDCGVILGTAKAEERIAAVLDNVWDATGGRLDVVVATHEHWDHVSGFVQAAERFAPASDSAPRRPVLQVEQVWMGWTEDPSDRTADAIRKDRERKQRGLAAALNEAKRRGLAMDSGVPGGVASLMSFFGVGAGADGLFAARGTTSDALESVRGFGRRPVRYCRPDAAPWTDPALPGLRIYTLGPPLQEKMLKKTFAKAEVYHLAGGVPAEAFFAAAGGLAFAGDSAEDVFERYRPFDAAHDAADLVSLRELAEAAPAPDAPAEANPVVEFFARHYFGRGPDAAPDQDWRRIDGAWLDAARDFALQLDSATNNTSLVLAIELTASKKVLLFAADAQVGNWLSWQDLGWKVDGERVTGPDLLRRTVFYKVGHHGSHNATLKEKGLELMSRDGFVAFLPVDHAMAKEKGWKRMPLPSLVEELRERAEGRLVRIDEDFDFAALGERGARIARDFERRLSADRLYYDYRLDDR
jgi:hypothetical protein